MTDIERIPSMRQAPKSGLPRKPRQPGAASVAKPVGKPRPQVVADEREAAGEFPKAAAQPTTIESRPPTPADQPTELVLDFEPKPPAAPVVEPPAALESVPDPPGEAMRRQAPRPGPAREPLPLTVREMFRQVDEAWAVFRAAAFRFPAERMDEHLTDGGWTRKQMLAHVAAWHDLTSDRLVKLVNSGRSAPLDRDVDAINAGVARIAIGKTAGEVLKDVEATFNRLRRQMQRLTDAQLHIDDRWAAQIIAGNTYEHYAEHLADLYPAEPVEGARRH